jgi:hypothetical protein
MFKLTLLCLLCCIVHIAFAQHIKISATQGIAYDGNKKNDSLFLVQSYNVSQLRVGYHYGKLGIISNITYVQQKDFDITASSEDARIPKVVLPISAQFPRKYANVQSLLTTLGLELCVPIIKRKAQLNFYVTYGLTFSKSDSVVFYDVNVPLYSHKLNSNITGCLQAGFSFNYKINSHLILKWQNEWNNYKLPYDEIDFRKTPTFAKGKQAKNIIVSSIGVAYIF